MSKQANVDAIIAEVFRTSGIKLTADDPVIAILLVQEARLKALFEEQRIGIQQGLAEYAAEIDDSMKATVKAAEELKTYREQILAELLAKSDEQLKESSGRVYAALQPKIEAQNKVLVESVAAQMNRTWIQAGLYFSVLLLVWKIVYTQLLCSQRKRRWLPRLKWIHRSFRLKVSLHNSGCFRCIRTVRFISD